MFSSLCDSNIRLSEEPSALFSSYSSIRYSEQAHSIPRNLSSKTSTCSKLHQLNLTVQNRYKTSVTRQSTTVGSAWFKHLWGNKISSFCGALVFLTHRPPLKRSGVKQKSGGFFYCFRSFQSVVVVVVVVVTAKIAYSYE